MTNLQVRFFCEFTAISPVHFLGNFRSYCVSQQNTNYKAKHKKMLVIHFLTLSLYGESIFLVCGDFNNDTLDCKPISKSYFILIKSCGAHILNRDSTRITPTSSKCIDHLIANFDANVKTLDSTISDHFSVIVSGYVIVDPQEN